MAVDTYECAVCHRIAPLTVYTAYDDFYGDLCDGCWEQKVRRATHNPWNGQPRA